MKFLSSSVVLIAVCTLNSCKSSSGSLEDAADVKASTVSEANFEKELKSQTDEGGVILTDCVRDATDGNKNKYRLRFVMVQTEGYPTRANAYYQKKISDRGYYDPQLSRFSCVYDRTKDQHMGWLCTPKGSDAYKRVEVSSVSVRLYTSNDINNNHAPEYMECNTKTPQNL